jgi:hypothetical protein
MTPQSIARPSASRAGIMGGMSQIWEAVKIAVPLITAITVLLWARAYLGETYSIIPGTLCASVGIFPLVQWLNHRDSNNRPPDPP